MTFSEEEREVLLGLAETRLRQPKPKPKDYPEWRERRVVEELAVKLRLA